MKDAYAVQHSNNGESEKEFGLPDTHMQDVVPVREKRRKSEKANMPMRGKLTLLVIAIQAALIILFAIFVEYEETDKDEHTMPMDGVRSYYPMYKDIHIMIFIGFGFLMTFLKKYGYGSVSFNLLLAAIAIQWAALLEGFFAHSGSKFTVNIDTLINADFAAAAVLISFGAVLGKTSPVQLVMMTMFEIALYHLNSWIGVKYFKAADIGGSMFIHVFGAYFGLAFSLVIYRKDVKDAEDDAGSVYHSDIFSMIGTLFLWIFWPSFNAAFATGDGQYRALINTYYSLAACTVVSFALSSLVNKGGKIDMVHIQNATLAGGVAVGTAADMVVNPWGALIIGSIAGIVSVLGFRFITPFLDSKIRLNDTCGVNNLHGMPGLMAAIVGIVAAACAKESKYGDSLYTVFPAMAPTNVTRTRLMNVEPGDDRSAGEQAAYQAATLATTLGIAIAGGLVSGALLKPSFWEQPRDKQIHSDEDYWLLPEDGYPEQVDVQVVTGYVGPIDGTTKI